MKFSPEFSIQNTSKQQLLNYFNHSYSLYQNLFYVLLPQGFYVKSQPLRHPLIFYYPHTAAFYINKMFEAGLIKQRFNPEYDQLFSIGIDQLDCTDINDAQIVFPTLEKAKEYRNKVKQIVINWIQTQYRDGSLGWNDPSWMIIMSIEHQRLHLQTSAVIIQRLDIKYIKSEMQKQFPICPHIGEGVKNEMVMVSSQKVIIKKSIHDHQYYFWDNQIGHHQSYINCFKASKYLVSNAQFMEFVKNGGYNTKNYWTPQGYKWLQSFKPKHPIFWIPSEKGYKYRTLLKQIDLPMNWPVEVNNNEAKAFCNWKSQMENKKYRLPTQDEWYLLRRKHKQVDEKSYNIGLNWFSPCPVDMFVNEGFADIIGNVWQHTQTAFYPFANFINHKNYQQYSTAHFDNRHNLIKGASWISTGNLLSKTNRFAFQRHYYQFVGFRYIQSCYQPQQKFTNKYQTDKTTYQYLEFHYGNEYFGKGNYPQKCARVCIQNAKKYKIGKKKALDVGCAVGRSTFELGRYFESMQGIDISVRFIQICKRMFLRKLCFKVIEEGQIYQNRYIDLKDLKIDNVEKRIKFYQKDAQDLDFSIFHSYDLVFCGNLIDRMHTPCRFLKKVHSLLNSHGLLVISDPYTWLQKYTPKSQWIGGYYDQQNKEVLTLQVVKSILKQNFVLVEQPEDIQFVMRETKRKYNLGVAQLCIWQKIN